MSQISPIILQAQISPPPGGGSFGLADTTRLENPFQGPMWLDEIRIRLPDPQGGEAPIAWSTLSLELKLGETPLTRSFVPIGLFGKVLSDSGDGGSNGTTAELTWKLPKPLFIPARELLRPTFYCAPFTGAPAKTITILYSCRPLPKGTPQPQVLQIPWVSYFVPPAMTMPNPADRTDQSTPSDLYNPWDEELHVQRFVGRLMPQNSGNDIQDYMSIASAFVSISQANVVTYGVPIGQVISGTLVSAQDSFNNILVRDPTPFAHVFDFLDRAWTVNCILPPKGFYLFTIDRLWNRYTRPGTITVGIGMVGWRDVKVQRSIRDLERVGVLR